jgi:uncharacterized protein YdeI (YjbR/CyaY-like superfamily)
MAMITEIEDYFTLGCGRCARFATPDCSTRRWDEGLKALRTLCREAGLTEAVKWGHPCYGVGGRNVAIIGAFRQDFRLSFFDAALLSHPALERQGPNTRHPDALRFTDNAQVAERAPVIAALLAEAKAHAVAGRRPPAEDRDLDLPDELVAAMDDDPELAEAFHALTPGRQTSHLIQLRGAKSPATVVARIARLRPKILAGKGATER